MYYNEKEIIQSETAKKKEDKSIPYDMATIKTLGSRGSPPILGNNRDCMVIQLTHLRAKHWVMFELQPLNMAMIRVANDKV